MLPAKFRFVWPSGSRVNNFLEIKDWATGTILNTEGELVCSGRVSSSFYTSSTFVTLVTNQMIHLEWGRYLFTIVLSVLRFINSDYPIGIYLFPQLLILLVSSIIYQWITNYLKKKQNNCGHVSHVETSLRSSAVGILVLLWYIVDYYSSCKKLSL